MNDCRVSKAINRSNFLALLMFAVALLIAAPLHAQDYSSPAQDPPGRVARIAFAQGNVSLEPAGVSTFSQAELNYPLTAGDRVYVDNDSLAELQMGGLAVRMGNGADVTVSSLTDGVAQFGLAQGCIRVRTRDLSAPPDANGNPQQGLVEIDTPNGTIVVQRPGDIRVDSYPQDDSTVVTVSSGSVEVTGPGGLDQVIGPDQAMRFIGSPVVIQQVSPLPPDALDSFDQQQEAAFNASLGVRDDYVSPDMIGAADLDGYGDWAPYPEYGVVWYPRTVAIGWAPYQNGHWAWVAPWGWTWIEAEPWGFAPFHYGRWAYIDGRWGWIPGPPPGVWGRPVRPVYSPALVVFVGGGVGITAWFPLGPGEVFQPWYHASAVYVNRVNVTNIYSRNATELRSAYSNRTTVVFNTNVTNVAYANRATATTAVAQSDFAAGRPVAASARVSPAVRAQLAQAPIVPHPLVTPTAAMAAPHAPARAIPPNPARPVLATSGGVVRQGVPTAPATAQPAQPARGSFPEQRAPAPAAVPAPARPATPPPAARPPDAARPLVTQTPPAPAQPSFADQQREIQRVDPGRPLGPQQVQNVREGKPAGPPSQPERVQHPAPAKAPPPPARKPSK